MAWPPDSRDPPDSGVGSSVPWTLVLDRGWGGPRKSEMAGERVRTRACPGMHLRGAAPGCLLTSCRQHSAALVRSALPLSRRPGTGLSGSCSVPQPPSVAWAGLRLCLCVPRPPPPRLSAPLHLLEALPPSRAQLQCRLLQAGPLVGAALLLTALALAPLPGGTCHPACEAGGHFLNTEVPGTWQCLVRPCWPPAEGTIPAPPRQVCTRIVQTKQRKGPGHPYSAAPVGAGPHTSTGNRCCGG